MIILTMSLFTSKLALLGFAPSQAYVNLDVNEFTVYCRSGRRRANACSILAKEGYKDLSNLSTGIIGWTESGKPVVK